MKMEEVLKVHQELLESVRGLSKEELRHVQTHLTME